MNRFQDRLEKITGARNSLGKVFGLSLDLQFGASYLEIEAVEPVPLLRRDLLADLPSVFSRCDDAGENGSLVFRVEGQGLGQRVRLAGPLFVLRPFKGLEGGLPPSF